MDLKNVKVVAGDSVVCDLSTGNSISGVVKALETAKNESNSKLTSLVEEFGAGNMDLKDEDMEQDQNEEEEDMVEEGLKKTGTSKKKSSKEDPVTLLHKMAKDEAIDLRSKEFALFLDKQDKLREFREEFSFPPRPGTKEKSLYFCGNSLGLMPKSVRSTIEAELVAWETHGVEAHFRGERPWAHADDFVRKQMAHIVGALEEEVVVMNGLTTNLHLMMIAFYRPTAKRFKIMIEKKAFPSDLYAVQSQMKLRGIDPSNLIEVEPREGELTLRTEDILKEIETHGDSVALVMFSGVQYYTGQFFEMQKITAAGKKKGCMVGWDLAHAAGNVVVKLHDWKVDFAVWCSYKYINSGPGGIAGAFLHKSHHGEDLQRLAGWWSQNWKTRFDMCQPFDPIPDAYGFRLSNPPIFQIASCFASVTLFEKATMQGLRDKSELLTGYLQILLQSWDKGSIEIITPLDYRQRGAQLSVLCHFDLERAMEILLEKGVIFDTRKPDVIRIAPAPFYNSFQDVYEMNEILREVVQGLK